MWTRTADGSVEDQHGKVIFFSTKRFVDDICLGECCFICGAKPGTKEFNDEHILPEWLLRRYDLFAQRITLPNGKAVRYDGYTVPCCSECNSRMGYEIERPISKAVRAGAEAISDLLINDSLRLIVWMGLIHLKTHLKDRAMRVNLDERLGKERIADEYDWAHLHHLHCLVRCFYTGCEVHQDAIGTFLLMSASTDVPEQFDFADLYLAQTMLLRMGDLAIVSVFNDSGGAITFFGKRTHRLTAPLSPIQSREVMAEVAWLNLHLKVRPLFRTDLDLQKETCRIVVMRPPHAELEELDFKVRGKLLRHALNGFPNGMQIAGRTREEAEQLLEAGKLTFLFDENGKFNTQSTPS